MTISPGDIAEVEDSSEVAALNAATAKLHEEGAARRLIQMVVTRFHDLPQESRAKFDALMRGLEVPAFRVGKVPVPHLPQLVRKYPRLERRLLRSLFPFWLELHAGLPETVEDTGRKVAPDVDFARGDWASIVGAVPAIAARMPRHGRGDLLVALFARRFGRFITTLLSGTGPHSQRPGSADATPAPKDSGNSEVAQDDAGATADSPSAPSRDPRVQQVVGRFHELLHELREIDETSVLWDEQILTFSDELGTLRNTKLEARAVAGSRDGIRKLLAQLQAQPLQDELEFLRIRGRCALWSADGGSLGDVRLLTTRLSELVTLVESHRAARVGAQHAENDDELEAHTSKRKEAKIRLLALIAEAEPYLQPGAGTDAPPVAEQSRPTTSAPIVVEGGAESRPLVPSVDVDEPPAASESAPRDDAMVAPPPSVDKGTLASDEPSERTLPPKSEALQGPPAVATPSAPPPSELPAASLKELPQELISYDQFREHCWISPTSVIETAPWRAPDYGERLAAAALGMLSEGPSRAWRLLVLVRALEAVGADTPIAPAEVRAAASLWASPGSASAGLDQERCERLRHGRAAVGSPNQRVSLVLEALRPSTERQLLSHEIETLVEHAEFGSGALRVVVQRFLAARALGHDALELLRRSKRTSPDQGRDLATRLGNARKDLQTLVTRVWSAAGGRVQRTHCRKAWSDFIDLIHPSLTRLYPPPRGDDAWTIAQALQDVDGYDTALAALCETYGAKFDDKRHMLRTATEIADAARRVIDLRRDLLSVSDGKKPAVALPELEIKQLGSTKLSAAEEEFARLLLLRVLNGPVDAEEVPHPLAITIDDVCARPDLLRVIRDVPPESVEALRRPNGALAYADDLPEPIRAAAVLLAPAEEGTEPTLEALVAGLERSQRGPLLGLIVQALDDRLQRRIHAERTDALARLSASVSSISQDADDLAQLGNRFAIPLRSIRDHARALVEGDDVRIDARLTETWLERVHETGRRLVTEHVAMLGAEAARRDNSEEIRVALERGHFGRAIRMLWGHGGSELRVTRQTEWRDDAHANREAMQRSFYANGDTKLRPLVDAWRVGVKGDAVRADRTLRTEFVRLVTDNRNMDRESSPAHMAIPMPAINAELARDQLMPTWMPQLSRFGRLVVLTPPVSPEQPSFRQATLLRAADFSQDLVVFLSPRLTAVRRNEVLGEMRRRGIAAALVDDLDVLRLVNPGGERPHLMLGLLEIVFEQQRRAAFSPFELPEGSHVRLEMYVGRGDKARELARTANYSRLFSGRKLGKSALLRFIERTEDGVKLPSGKVLRVVYVPAVGIESEAAMVDAILTSLETALNLRFERRAELEPADRLATVLSGYLDAHSGVSLLLVLDEADVFFERQLAEYEERRERCLSFQMRSRFTASTDEQGLPRVRFVFAGYRVTNRSQGAWSNWGLVLSLDPLEPEDAARLISAPLAVMGIDIGAHAHEIAYRCGYQPAILLRFGERLMDHLERQPHRSGDRHVVSPSDIAQVLDDQRVHEEIRTIARNNFEGNPAALIVFGAVLRELLELPPGQPLRDAPERILDRLRSIDPDLAWLEREGDGSAAVRGYLSDFVERSLLRERRVDAEPSYSLRFPHHLTILANLSDVARIKEELRRLRSRSDGAAEHVERALVPPRVLRDLGDAGQAHSNAIAIVGTLWPAAAYDRAGGIPDRLGVTGDETTDAHAVLEGRCALATIHAIRRVDVPAAEHIIAELRSAATRPMLMGGIDLLRWAIARRKESGDLLYEVHGVGRLTIARLTWWLQRVRGLEFARADAIERIHIRTGGIPLLLDVVDGQLATAAGTTVSDERVTLALGAVDEAITTIARDLATGRPSVALDPREREILQMIECVVRVDKSAGLDLRSALTDLWEIFSDSCPIPPLGGGDALPLEVLIESGLLPVKPSAPREDPLARLGPLPTTDPVLALVRAFPPDRRDLTSR